MRYLGGKNRLAKRIAAVVERVRPAGAPYYEPFMGSCAVGALVSGERHLSDTCEPLVTMWRAAVYGGWRPPMELSESEWRLLRALEDPRDPLTAFAGFGCSYSGKWFSGYSRDGDRNFAAEASRSILKRAPLLEGASIEHADYRDLSPPSGAIIYCDPPYEGVTGYQATGRFDSAYFWRVVSAWALDCVVLVSEYRSPPNWIGAELAWSMERRNQINCERVNTEKVWIVR